jgi:hypothetical protein
MVVIAIAFINSYTIHFPHDYQITASSACPLLYQHCHICNMWTYVEHKDMKIIKIAVTTAKPEWMETCDSRFGRSSRLMIGDTKMKESVN